MKVESKVVGPCKAKVFVKAEAEETRNEYESVLKQFMAQGKVPGFRAGKVPREIIKRTFYKEITEEVQSRLFRALYKPALEQRQIKMVSVCDVGDMLFSPETGISFSMTVDTRAEAPLPKYKKIPVTFEDPVLAEEQVDEQIEQMRKAYANFEDAAEGKLAEEGDLVCIDYTATLDGQPLGEVVAEAESIAKATDFWVQIEQGRFLPEVIEGVKGQHVGAQLTCTVAFADEHSISGLKGKKAEYQVTVKALRTRQVLKDEELLKQMRVESQEQLRETVRQSMLSTLQQEEKRRREQTVIEFLLKKADFDLPESEVADEVNVTLDRMLSEARYRGLTREDLEQNRAQILESASTAAKRQLRLRYILEAIAEAESIELTEEEIDAKLKTLAGEFRSTPEKVRAQIEKNGRMEQLRGQVRDEKTLAFLLNTAKA